jgi:Fe-S-cluster containining protein
MTTHPFYANGLQFSCKRCSSCCRLESGFVYLSENDLSRLANELKMEYTPFITTWCRWVSFDRESERLALKEKSNFDCIFWNQQCTVYRARPLQCRTFPFWDNVVCSPSAWETAASGCPGLNNGERHTGEEIGEFLRMTGEEQIIERKIPRIGG